MIRLSRALLGAALVVGLAGTGARAADPDKLIPADADTVAVVNVKQVLDSEIVKKYALGQIKQMLEGQDAKRMLSDLGLDPLKDIEQLVVATMDTSRTDTKFLMIVHGKFDAEKIYKAAEAETKKNPDKFSMVKDGKDVMFKFQPDNGQPPVFATVVNDKTVVAANEKKYVTGALKASDNKTPINLKQELSSLLKKMDDKASVSVVSVLKGKLDDVKLPGGGNLPIKVDALEKALPNAETVSVAVKIGADVSVDVTIGMKDTDAAADMRNALDDLLKQLKPLAQLAGAADPRAKPLGDVLGTIKTSAKNKDVVLSGKVTGANIGKMINPTGE